MADENNTVSDLADLKDIAGGAADATPTAEGTEAIIVPVSTAPLREKEVDAQGRAYATGRRKDAVARVWIKPGSGKVTVNGREQEVYFARPTLRLVINQPFLVADREGAVRRHRHRQGRRAFGPGRCGQARHQPGADQVRAGTARRGEGRRLPYPRQPRGRAQEVRPRQGPQELPVLEALRPSAQVSATEENAKGGPPRGGRPFRLVIVSFANLGAGSAVNAPAGRPAEPHRWGQPAHPVRAAALRLPAHSRPACPGSGYRRDCARALRFLRRPRSVR